MNKPDLGAIGESSIRWMARLLSLATGSAFLLIMFLAISNEDKPQPTAVPIIVLLGLTVLGSFAAWRWEKVGGVLVVLGALGLGVAAYSTSRAFGVGSLSLLTSLIYALPFLVVGILFWVCGQRATVDSNE